MAFLVIQGHRVRYQWKARTRVNNSNWHHRTVSELSQLIGQILDTLRFWATF